MSAQKILIIVLVVLVVIFVITIGVGGCHGGGDSDDPGAVKSLKGLQGNRFLTIGDKASIGPPPPAPTCAVTGPDGRVLRVDGECTITLGKRAFFRKSTRVVLQPSGRVRVRVRPKKGPDQDETVTNECFGTAINRAGGTITLTPLSSPAPTVTLLRMACPE